MDPDLIPRDMLHVKKPLPPGSAAFWTSEEAPGAIPNGTIVEKTGSEPGDGHQDGARAEVLGSMRGRHPDRPGEFMYGYFIRWEDTPEKPCFIAGPRIRPVS